MAQAVEENAKQMVEEKVKYLKELLKNDKESFDKWVETMYVKKGRFYMVSYFQTCNFDEILQLVVNFG